MKKFHLALVLMFTLLSASAQTKTEKISILDIKEISFRITYGRSINLESKDTSLYVFVGYKNLEFEYITEISSIYFSLPVDLGYLKEFINDLKQASSEIGKSSTIAWDRKYYVIQVYDFDKKFLYLRTPKDEISKGYTKLNAIHVQKIIQWFEQNKLG